MPLFENNIGFKQLIRPLHWPEGLRRLSGAARL
jgi:hypothetical protein